MLLSLAEDGLDCLFIEKNFAHLLRSLLQHSIDISPVYNVAKSRHYSLGDFARVLIPDEKSSSKVKLDSIFLKFSCRHSIQLIGVFGIGCVF